MIGRTLRTETWRRANDCCEYCFVPQQFIDASHEIDHIIAEKHHGVSSLDNLALACFSCNNHKGPNIAGYDPVTKQTIPLYHPRQQNWAEHFAWAGPILIGLTPVGRVTVDVLAINEAHRVAHRRCLVEEGVYPIRR